MDVPKLINEIRSLTNVSLQDLAQAIGASLLSMHKWESGTGKPSPVQLQNLEMILNSLKQGNGIARGMSGTVFAARGVRQKSYANTLFDYLAPRVELTEKPISPIISRISKGNFFLDDGEALMCRLLARYSEPAVTIVEPPRAGMSAGKNTYTYDAHTYHTKVPPQGIAELVRYYLPHGGLVLDPFAGSGMTGVACNAIGVDAILNELSPAACFISSRFTSYVSPDMFEAGVRAVLDEVERLRQELYTTLCRECHNPTEILYTIWSYNIICSNCTHEFQAWDHCREYGQSVREHKILKRFPCPQCNQIVNKSVAQRTTSQPVVAVYKCCQKEYKHHPLSAADLELVYRIEKEPQVEWDFTPRAILPNGVNLRQPKKHGLNSIEQFYTRRNLSAMSHLWKTIHRVADREVAGFLAFVFTSLYQRVTRLSEFRFWGGSGNMARFNVPFVSKEANVFDTFARKARSIQDHLQTTAANYQARSVVVRSSATSLNYLPDSSIDLIFTDPPFGANINYSEVNLLWEAWLGVFTDTTYEAIINSIQGKGVSEYQELMTASLSECYRVLRPGHWMLLMFMNSSESVFQALRNAITSSGFSIERVDIFDKQHATFKQLVSENTPGADLVFHCFKPRAAYQSNNSKLEAQTSQNRSIHEFLTSIDTQEYRIDYLHVNRESEFDFRRLYSEWLSQQIRTNSMLIDYSDFRSIVIEWLHSNFNSR
jgi:DNA modification methylase/DNA-binding Xre family transcriptional regulator